MKEKKLYDIFDKCSKNEVKKVINLIPKKNMTDFIIKNQSIYKSEIGIKGTRSIHWSRPDMLNAFYSVIIEKKDITTLKFVYVFINKLVEAINSEIEEVNDIQERIAIDNIFLEKFLKLLLKSPFKNDIYIFFMLTNVFLSEEMLVKVKNKIIKIKENIFLEKKIKEKILVQHEKEITILNKKHKKEIREKDLKEKELKNQINNLEKSFKDSLLEKKMNLEEIEKMNLEIKNELNNERIKENNLETKLNNKINKLNNRINKLKSQLEEIEIENKNLNIILNKKCTEFDKFAEERWINSTQKLRDNFNETMNKLKQQESSTKEKVVHLKETKTNLETEIIELELEKVELINDINLLEGKAGEFLNRFNLIFDKVNKNKKEVRKELQHLKYNVGTEENNIDCAMEISDYNDFIDDLSENLRNLGIKPEYNILLSEYIFATYSNEMSLMLVGYKASEVANAFSNIICSRNADIISLPLGFNDKKELLKIVDNCESEVVVIENILDVISESTYLPLLKLNTKKYIIFSLESDENLRVLSKALYNYFMTVNIDEIIEISESSEIIKSYTERSIFECDIDINLKKKNYKKLKKIRSLSNIVTIKYSEIISTLFEKFNTDLSTGLYSLMMFSFNSFLHNEEEKEGLLEDLEDLISNNERYDKIVDYIGDKNE